MAGIKHSNITFLLFNIFSRALIPFSSILYTSLRLATVPSTLQSPLDTWLMNCFGLSFFLFLQSSVLKQCRIRYRRKDLWLLGITWVGLAIVVHSFSFSLMSSVTGGIFQQYCLCTPWPYMLLGLLFAPRICITTLRRRFF